MEVCKERAEAAQHEAIAAETNESVPAEDYVQKLQIATDAEIAVMACTRYQDLKTTLENEAKKLMTWREKEQKSADCQIVINGRKFGPKVGKKAAHAAKRARLKRIEAYSTRIKKATSAAAMASQRKGEAQGLLSARRTSAVTGELEPISSK